MGKSEFRMKIEDTVQQRHSKVHPWSEAWVSGKLNKRLLGEWVKQHYHYVSHFPTWMATMYSNAQPEDVRLHLLENIAEEDGLLGSGSHKPVSHTELLLGFGGHCGVGRNEILDTQINGELLPETLGLQSWGYRQSHKPYLEAIAGLLVGLESQVPEIYMKTTPALLEKYGFTDEQVVFFTLHIEADQEHSGRGYQLLEKYIESDAEKEACLRSVREATMMRRLYLDGLYNKFLAADKTAAA